MAAPTQAEIARALGVDPALVTRYRRRGMPVDTVAAAQEWKQANVRPRAGGRAAAAPPAAAAPDGTGAAPGYADHRARREKADADMAELQARRRAGELIELGPAERAAFDAFRELRDATFAAMRSAAPVVLGLTDAREVQHVLEDALRSAYADFEARVQRRLSDLKT